MKKILFSFLSIILVISILISKPIISVNANALFEEFTSKSYILLDKESGEVITESNSTKKLPVASICKLMTSLITLEKIENSVIDLEDEVIASNYACSMEGSQAFLDEDCKYKIKDLLKSVIVASANDSSVVLSETISGSEKEFVKLMNERAKDLGMNDTVYENSTGLSTPNQYSTAFDTSLILREISKHDLYNELSNIWMDTFTHPSGRITDLVNTNRLIKYYANTLNGKTGFTDEAGYCLASTASNSDLTLIAVVLGCDTPAPRFSESIQLYNYGFANFENKQILFKNQALENSVKVNNGKERIVKVGVKSNFYILNKKGEDSSVNVKYDIKLSAKAPIQVGDVLGKCYIIKNGKIVGDEDIVVLTAIEKQNYKDIIEKVGQDWNLIKVR